MCIGPRSDRTRTGPKTEFRIGGGPKTGPDRTGNAQTGPDRSGPSIHVLLASNAARSARAQWHDRAASFPKIFFFGIRTVQSNLQTRDFLASNAARSTRAASFPEKKFFFAQIQSIGPVHRSNPGPDRIPNSAKC